MKRLIRIMTTILVVMIPYGIIKFLIIPSPSDHQQEKQSKLSSTEWENDSITLLLDSDNEFAIYKVDTIIYGHYHWTSPIKLILNPFKDESFFLELSKEGDSTLKFENGESIKLIKRY